jgi:Methyltransferase domain
LLQNRLRRRWDRKHKPHFGRRVGWYVVARTQKPRVVVETGIHDGLGSLLLLRALDRNAEEGHDGRLISFDVNPRAGWLVSGRLRGRWQAVYEATVDALEHVVEGLEVGMIVHDSEHTYECERFELTTALSHASSTIALVSDNAHATTALRDIARDLRIDYHFFRERPRGHFYPGAGIGLAICRRGVTTP